MLRLARWDRSDFLITRAVLLLVGVGALVGAVGGPLLSWATGSQLQAQVATAHSDPLPHSLATAKTGAGLRWDGVLDLRIDDPSLGLRLSTALPGVLLAVIVATCAWILFRWVGSVGEGRPFAPAGVRSLRLIGWLIALGAVVIPMVELFTNSALVMAATTLKVAPSATFEFGWFLVAALVLVVAESLQVGVRLSEDVEGLV